ncbi:MAG: DUF2779 domain-containing protein [Deltaproteobacteria bacterium]|nr:DUF2779 domain-containing protein [Deltaproteobacteria bacterium]
MAKLSKSRYLTGIKCLKALYLGTKQPKLKKNLDEAEKFLFQQGHEVGNLAKTFFKDGIDICTIQERGLEKQIELTQKVLEKEPQAIFEATFEYNDILVKADILEKTETGWNLIEVKSTTKVEDHLIDDVAIQYYVLKNNNINIENTFLMHVNTECTYPELSNFFIKEDITDKVLIKQIGIESNLKRQFETLKLETAPNIDIGPYCNEPYECPFKSHCWQHVTEHSVFELYHLKNTEKFKLYKSGILKIKDLPENYKLNVFQYAQKKTIEENKPYIDKEGIENFINQLQYPIHFLDFETANPAIPLFKGIHPYEQLPFQFSCHILDSEGNITHKDFLDLNKKDPRPAFIQNLLDTIGDNGSVIAYHASFEKMILNNLSKIFLPFEDEINNIATNMIDLEEVFQKFYYDPKFYGSLSLKSILPVLCPELTYEDLDINKGTLASVAYLNVQKTKLSSSKIKKIEQDLKKYCKLDTLALLKIFEVLNNLVFPKIKQSHG